MKKLILSIVGVVSLTAGSWGQTSDTFELTGVTYTNGPSVYNYSGPGWTYNISGAEVIYKRQNTNGTWNHIWFEYGKPHTAFTSTNQNASVGPRLHEINPSTWPTNIVVNAGYLTNADYLWLSDDYWQSMWPPEPAWVTQNMAPAPTPTPTPTPTPEPEPEVTGGGDVIVDQAQQLNIGLEFNDGQWTPAQ